MRIASRLIVGVLLAGALHACLFDERVLVPGQPRILVHAVLDPDSPQPRVLLEEVRAGQEPVGSGPLAETGGIPISSARVVLYAPNGDSAIGREDLYDQGRQGVYYFSNDSTTGLGHDIPIRRGELYRLHVTVGGRPTLRATTLVPDGAWQGMEFMPGYFNVDRDTLRLNWPAAGGAGRYAAFIRSGTRLFRIFESGLSLVLAERERLTVTGIEAGTFVPGSDQLILITAVDTNYFDYYRSRVNPLTGTGQITHVEGGIGLFGAVSGLRQLQVRSVGIQSDRVEGLFQRIDGADVDAPEWIDLYLDRETVFNDDAYRRFVGRFGPDSLVRAGSLNGLRELHTSGLMDVGFALPQGDYFSGELHGTDTITGMLLGKEAGGTVTYLRRRTIR